MGENYVCKFIKFIQNANEVLQTQFVAPRRLDYPIATYSSKHIKRGVSNIGHRYVNHSNQLIFTGIL